MSACAASCATLKHVERMHADELLARRVAGETLRDLRTVRKEIRDPGSVRGVAGEAIRTALAHLRAAEPHRAA